MRANAIWSFIAWTWLQNPSIWNLCNWCMRPWCSNMLEPIYARADHCLPCCSGFEQGVTASQFPSMQRLKDHFSLIDPTCSANRLRNVDFV